MNCSTGKKLIKKKLVGEHSVSEENSLVRHFCYYEKCGKSKAKKLLILANDVSIYRDYMFFCSLLSE